MSDLRRADTEAAGDKGPGSRSHSRLDGATGKALGYHIQNAAANASVAELRSGLESGGNPRCRSNVGGALPLHLACGAREVNNRGFFSSASIQRPAQDNEERVECVDILLAAGARLEERDQSGQSALHWAAKMGLGRVCQALIAKGADVEAKDARGATPLMHACERHDGYRDGGVEDVLLAAGARVAEQDNRGETAMHKAVGNPGAIGRLAKAGALVDAQDKAGRTPMCPAVATNRATSVGLLLAHGANPCVRDAQGRLPSQLGSGGGAAWRLARAAEEAAGIEEHLVVFKSGDGKGLGKAPKPRL